MDHKQADKDPTRVPDEPTIKESTWLSLVLAAGLISIPVLSFLLAWTLEVSDQEALKRFEILKLIGAACVTIVTLLTVIWRGVVTTRQADQQYQQTEQQIRQNDAKDEENLAKLLIDGTKLISEGDDKRGNVLAGIAALQAVVTSPNSRFASQAMDLLIEPINANYKKHNSARYLAALRALEAGADVGRISTRPIRLTGKNSDGSLLTWRAVNGAQKVTYESGVFYQTEYEKILDFNRCNFIGVTFEKMTLSLDSRFSKCIFINCKIERTSFKVLHNCVFNHCDFSDFRFSDELKEVEFDLEFNSLETIKNRKNYFWSNSPPTPVKNLNWLEYVEVRQYDSEVYI